MKFGELLVPQIWGRGTFGKMKVEMGGNGGRGWIDLGEAVSNAPFLGVYFLHKKIRTAQTVEKPRKSSKIWISPPLTPIHYVGNMVGVRGIWGLT